MVGWNLLGSVSRRQTFDIIGTGVVAMWFMRLCGHHDSCVSHCTDRSGDGSISLTEFLGFCRKDKKSFGCVCVGCHAGVAVAGNL